jgi:hypothetical protein
MNIKSSLAAILLLFSGITSFSQEKSIGIRFLQDVSSNLSDFETHLLLTRKGFRIQVALENIRGVYVFASLKDSVYRFNETDSIRDFIYLPMLELKEDRYNSERELNISETGWSYWFYDPNGEHTFNTKVWKLYGDKTVCTRFIKQLYDVNNDRVIDMKDISAPLYMFFIAVRDYDKDGRPMTELIRKKVKIEWRDDD